MPLVPTTAEDLGRFYHSFIVMTSAEEIGVWLLSAYVQGAD